ncbi:MAG: SDR family NAD(P)-dependent oxidoreductase [Planctomycetota bacterium]|jgi:short-subunit dehydrogenase
MSEQRVAIVTGASSGIGEATAVAFAREGYAVALAARRQEKLTQVAGRCEAASPAGGPFPVTPTDVSRPEQVEALVSRTVERFGRVDVLVNGAGFGVSARVHETTEEQMREIFEVNFFGVFYGCKAVAPVMMRQRSGHIFNISSVIGKRGCPLNGAYSATKFAVCGLTEAMRVEMMPYNVRLTTVCPGLTDTDFFSHVRGGTSLHRTSYARLRGLMPAEKIARKIVKSVGRNKPELIFSAGGRLLVFINARWPRLADRLMKYYHDDLLHAAEEPQQPQT